MDHKLLEMQGENASFEREVCDNEFIDQICTAVLNDMMIDLEIIFDENCEDTSGLPDNDFESERDSQLSSLYGNTIEVRMTVLSRPNIPAVDESTLFHRQSLLMKT